MSKQSHHYWLTAVFPWLSDGLANDLIRRLTDKDLVLLRKELHEAGMVLKRQFAKQLAGMTPNQRAEFIEAVINNEE